MTSRLSRAGLSRQGVAGGSALLLSGSAASVLTGSAAAAPPPDVDLAYPRLSIGAELPAADAYES